MRRIHPLWLLAIATVLIASVGFSYTLGVRQMATRLAPFVNDDNAELRVLEQKFGSSRNSEHAEEWIIRDFFGEERDGVFVDVGANHYQRFSNTYYLETALGWSGVAVEPQVKFAADYATYRPRTKFIPLFVSDVSNQKTMLYVPVNDLVASSDRRFAEAEGGDITPTPATTSTLDDILERSGITRIDFLTMDIELAEPAALAGFSIKKSRPRLICVEAHAPIRQRVLDYFAANGYVMVGKYWRVDSENLWFAPLGSAPDA